MTLFCGFHYHRWARLVQLVQRVGPVIGRSLVRNLDWTVTIFWAPLPSTGLLVSVCDQPPLICLGVYGRKAITKTQTQTHYHNVNRVSEHGCLASFDLHTAAGSRSWQGQRSKVVPCWVSYNLHTAAWTRSHKGQMSKGIYCAICCFSFSTIKLMVAW
jgi:hypothetical protein